MFAAIFTFLGAIPGLGAWLAKIGLIGGAYVKGRVDQSTSDRMAADEASLRETRARQHIEEELRRVSPDARRDRLLRWKR